MRSRPVLFIVFFVIVKILYAQSIKISGTVKDEAGNSIDGVTVHLQQSNKGAVTDNSGNFSINLPSGNGSLEFSHVQYDPVLITADFKSDTSVQIVMTERTTQLKDIEVQGESIKDDKVVTYQKISAKSAKGLPSAFGDFNKILVTLPGVSSNNELSSAYSVRGGNYAENLVYVNDMPVYRPFLSSPGRQQGLSFVNPDMVQDIEFYAGGWEPKYGDKLSSSLNIEYKEPDSLEAAVTAGLMGGTAYVGGKVKRMSYLVGARYRDSRYLLNTLNVKGQYFPKYTDVQSLLTFDLSGKNSQYINKTKLNILLSYGRNRYLTEPQSQSVEFGSIQQNYRLQTAFQGRELLNYDTYQTGFRLTHRFNSRLRSHLIGTTMFTNEREQYEVEGAYRLCDVDNNPGSSSFDECVVVRGVGTNYKYGRNSLKATLATLENRWEYMLSMNHILEAGAGVTFQDIKDHLNQYSFVDSSDYVHIESSIFNSNYINSRKYYGYAQGTYLWKDSVHAISYGVRTTYWDYNHQLLVSPRFSYRLAPKWEKTTTFKFSAGIYQQPPFYRELRGYDGTVHKNVYAQKSLHLIAGMTRLFYMWNRPFLFTTDVYNKQLWNIIPYDVDNVRLRYHPTQTATGYARGVDFRINGEFVKGTQSWFSFGLLQTRENIKGDTYIEYLDKNGNEIFPNSTNQNQIAQKVVKQMGSVRRPFDQRLNIAAYFEDHLPNDPSLRVYLNMIFGSGYPFGPPQSVRYRDAFKGDQYYRVDLGFSKEITPKFDRYNKLYVRLEVLNALGAKNTLSYTWIQDVNGNHFAIPNSLSARFLNLKLTAEL